MSSNNSQLLNIVLGNPFDVITEDREASQITPYLVPFRKRGFNQIDTATSYNKGEENFGKLDWKKEGFVVDTKVKSFTPGSHKAEEIHQSVVNSYGKLKVEKINILYLHSPDRSVPFEETLRALNEEYTRGKFERLGLSNYTVEEVKQIVEICDRNKWVRPTVYQGNYSIVVRSNEAELFPLLKKENISFYAWSPLAAGVLTGKVKRGIHDNASHFNNLFADNFKALFFRDSVFNVVDDLTALGAKHNLTTTEISLRWLAFHSQLSKSHGDAIILGASRPEQFESSFTDLEKGPLPKEVAQYVDALWEKTLKADPIPYHF